jgi:hypothetical protein
VTSLNFWLKELSSQCVLFSLTFAQERSTLPWQFCAIRRGIVVQFRAAQTEVSGVPSNEGRSNFQLGLACSLSGSFPRTLQRASPKRKPDNDLGMTPASANIFCLHLQKQGSLNAEQPLKEWAVTFSGSYRAPNIIRGCRWKHEDARLLLAVVRHSCEGICCDSYAIVKAGRLSVFLSALNISTDRCGPHLRLMAATTKIALVKGESDLKLACYWQTTYPRSEQPRNILPAMATLDYAMESCSRELI